MGLLNIDPFHENKQEQPVPNVIQNDEIKELKLITLDELMEMVEQKDK